MKILCILECRNRLVPSVFLILWRLWYQCVHYTKDHRLRSEFTQEAPLSTKFIHLSILFILILSAYQAVKELIALSNKPSSRLSCYNLSFLLAFWRQSFREGMQTCSGLLHEKLPSDDSSIILVLGPSIQKIRTQPGSSSPTSKGLVLSVQSGRLISALGPSIHEMYMQIRTFPHSSSHTSKGLIREVSGWSWPWAHLSRKSTKYLNYVDSFTIC